MRIRLYGRSPGRGPEAGVPIETTWEAAFEKLAELPRMFAEPDGSFLWTSDDPLVPWQLEGTLFDDGQVIRRVELVGNCPLREWQQFLSAFDCDWDNISVESLSDNQVFDGQWLRTQVVLDGSQA